jgi:hypothetical protein
MNLFKKTALDLKQSLAWHNIFSFGLHIYLYRLIIYVKSNNTEPKHKWLTSTN